MARRPKPQPPIKKNDIIKPKAGGHAMTVMDISKDGKRLTGSYTTPDGVRHDEQLKTDQVVRVAI